MARQRNMQTTTNAQMGLLDSLMIATPSQEPETKPVKEFRSPKDSTR
jgi:hypothetical protein